ncbi:MAG: zinc-ribbon domain-containing protein [Clostridia bacterium]|nr:zinc-ribbon domain-containing protein [Clostridia bacterium]
MKKCPKCRAEIQENARFCLYCMTSFEEKQEIKTKKENNKRWLIFVAAVLVFVVIIFSVFAIALNNKTGNSSNTTDYSPVISSENDCVASNGDKMSSQQNKENNKTESNKETLFTSTSSTKGSSLDNNSNVNTTSINTTDDEKSNVTSPKSGEVSKNSSKGSATSDNKTNNTDFDASLTTSTASLSSTPTQTVAVSYIYRDAKYGDDFSVGANLENSVVITGVKTASANGEYIIPDTLGGKKVIAVMGLAFCDEKISKTVKKVVVPSSVKNIWDNAFASCYNLTDIYFCGNSIYTEVNAFAEKSKRNGTLIIHCSANCSDRNYRYYKNSASNYGAKYEEWNG